MCPYFKSLYIKNITRHILIDLDNEHQTKIIRVEDSLASATVQDVYTFISMFFNFAYNNKIITRKRK